MKLEPDAVHLAIAQRIAGRAQKSPGGCLLVGLCGSQGSGKSTMVPILKQLLQERGLSVAIVSLDDLYLPLAEREKLARRVHPLLKTRGVPGTHDIALAKQMFAALCKPGRVALP